MCLHTVKWLNCFIWPIHGILTGTITPGQSGPGSNVNKKVLHSPLCSRTQASPSDILESYTGRSLEGSYLSVEMQSMCIYIYIEHKTFDIFVFDNYKPWYHNLHK